MASNLPTPSLPFTRREFLGAAARGIGVIAFSRLAPAFLANPALAAAAPAEKDRTILVLVQLAGGNDGLNTVVPFADDNYYRLRPTLAIPRASVLPLDGSLGLHPGCPALHRLFGDGKLAIVQNVGYPNPNRSHFRSSEIWETASASNEFLASGWIGRYLDNTCSGSPADSHDPLAVHVNTLNGEPETFLGARPHPTFGMAPYGVGRGGSDETRRLLEKDVGGPESGAADAVGYLRHTLMDALITERKVHDMLAGYRPEAEYPHHAFGASLRNIAALIASGLPTRVYFVTLGGFDTHVNQAPTQERLLATLSEGLASFQKDLAAHRLDDQVLTMTFSEFGRRPSENESRGTDHGTSAPLFVMGSRIRGGLHGTAPALDVPKNQDIAFSTDFRGVYATALEAWLGCPSAPVLGGRFPAVPIVA
jgi:uncharacterized protein (DUF1501 family)